MRKNIFIVLILLFTGLFSATAQLYPYNWRIGVSAGYATYFGDMSPYRVNGFSESGKLFRVFELNPNYIPQPSFQVSLEKRLNKTVNLTLKGGRYSFAMADRYENVKGELQTDTPRFIRSLNFKTDVTDIGLSLVFRADNDVLLNRKALLAPYLGIGAGVLWYDVYADLFDSEGNPYDYSTPEVDYDGNYETDLRPLRTESTSGYEQYAFYAELSLGFRIRLSHRWELFMQSDLRYTTTDYLDDVSGRYRAEYTSELQQYAANPIGMPEADGQNFRGNDDNLNDIYFYHGAGIKFSFGHQRESFRAPVITGQHWKPVSEKHSETPRNEKIRFQEKVVDHKVSRDSVKVDETLQEIIKPTIRFLEEEMAMLQLQQSTYELAIQEDSLHRQQLYLDSLENVLEAYLDSIPEDSLMQGELAERKRENEMLRLQLDSLEQQRLNLAMTSVDTAKTYHARTIEPTATQRDTAVTLTETVSITTDSLHQAELQAMKRAIEQMQRQQSQRDSVIIMQLADLLKNRPAVSSENIVTERYYTDTSGITQRPAPAQRYSPAAETGTSSLEIEALRSEVRSLRQQLANQQISAYPADISRSNENVVLVPGAPVIIRDSQRDTLSVDEFNAVVQERQRLQAENAQLRDELSRKERQLDLFLDPPNIEIAPAPIETLAIDTLPAPSDTLEKTEPDTTNLEEDKMLERLRDTADRLEAENLAKQGEEKAAREFGNEASTSEVKKNIETSEKPDPLEKSDLKPMQFNVFFELNSTTVKEADRTVLKNSADRWKLDISQQISLTSYADNTGNPEYNRQLCARRNEAVKNVLVDELGVDVAKIKTVIGGKVVRNGQAWNPNDRRVEVVVSPIQ